MKLSQGCPPSTLPQGLLKGLLVWIVEANLIGRVGKNWEYALEFSREE